MKQKQFEEKLYKSRFGEDFKQRNEIWNVLCKNFFQQYIASQDIVLDIASGYAEFINHIQCKEKIACDINPDARNFVNNNVKFLLNSSVKIALKNNSVDKIFISNFFEHISREEILQTLAELYRLLKPGGKVLVLQPNIRFCAKDYWMFFDHITPIDDRGLTEAFMLVKFKERYKIERFLPFTTMSRLPKHALFIKLYLMLRPLWHVMGKQSFLIYEK